MKICVETNETGILLRFFVLFRSTYCHVKLPVIPSLRRSRNERCLLGPDPMGIALLLARDDDEEVILPKIDKAVGLLPDVTCGVGECCCCCCNNEFSSVVESNDSSGNTVLMAVPLPPLKLQLAADVVPLPIIVLLMPNFLRGESVIEPCFGEHSRDDDIFFFFLFGYFLFFSFFKLEFNLEF